MFCLPLRDIFKARRANLRVGLAGAIGADDRGKVRIAKEEYMMALVGLEIWTMRQLLDSP